MRQIWRLGTIGTFFSIIVVYFIYKYAEVQGWKLLAFLAWIYLVIWGVIVGIILLVILLALISILIGLLWTFLKYRWLRKRVRKRAQHAQHAQGSTQTIEADYEVKK